MNKILTYLIVVASLFGFISCSSMDDDDCTTDTPDTTEKVEGNFFMKLNNLAGKTLDGSDKCDNVLLMIFDSNTGNRIISQEVAVNENGETKIIGLPERGSYDYYLFANTDFAGTQFKLVLDGIKNSKDFNKLRNVKIATDSYTPYTLANNRVLLYASYFKVDVPSASGTSVENPWILNANLTRAVAKIAVKFYQNSNLVGTNKVKSIKVRNVGSMIYAPTTGEYAELTADKIDLVYNEDEIESRFDYTKDVVGSIVFYVPEMLYKIGTNNDVKTSLEVQINDEVHKFKINTKVRAISNYLSLKGFHFNYDKIGPAFLNLNSILREMSYEFRIKLEDIDESHLAVTEWDREDGDDSNFIISPIEDFEDVEIPGVRP